jgi:hypothetical protein
MRRLKKFGLNFHPDAIRRANPTVEQLAERNLWKMLKEIEEEGIGQTGHLSRSIGIHLDPATTRY